MADIVIIGGGHAAAQAVMSLKQQKFTGSIALVSRENHLPYQRPPLSKAYLKGDLTAERLPIHREKLYADMAVELHLGIAAETIDPAAKTVALSDGNILSYGKLILATGGEARTLSLPGSDLSGLHYVRTKDHIDQMQADFAKATTIVIIGGGYIGLEIAAVARSLDKQVVVLEAEDRLLKRVTAPEVSDFYRDIHRSKGVDIHLNAVAAKLEGEAGHVQKVVCQDGRSFKADMVIAGIGLIANSQLAAAAGLDCHPAGIEVNAHCQTSDKDIYAIGDVTWHHNPFYGRSMRLESVQNAVDQAKVAVDHALNHRLGGVNIYDAQPWFWSDQYDLKLQMVGLNAGYDIIVERGDRTAGKVAFFYLQGGRMIAADCISSMAEFMGAKKLIAAKVDLTPDQLTADKPFKDIVAELL